jgi:DeoR/GlpR family transcriptional regulator of sugar metabolism
VTGGEGQDLAVRRETIKTLVLQDGFARIEDLTKLLGVSLMTVHRDLDALAHQGYLTKIRGGATANPNALLEARVPERVAAMQHEKTAIAAHAAKLLSPGQTVFIDDSTTAMAMVPHLIASAPITVATNFLPVVGKLAGVPGVELIVLGGVYHSVPEACFGSRTVENIGQLHADLALMSTTGITGVSCYHRSEITVTSRMAFLANATTTVLLVDHAKFGRPATYLLCKLTNFDLVITDTGIDPEDEQLLRAEGINLELAAPLPQHNGR